MSNISVAVVGCGGWGENHARVFSELKALVAIVEMNSERALDLSRKYGVKSLSFEEALADKKINAVIIATPAEYHAEQAIRAMEAGKHVLVEKPMALSLEDGERLVSKSKELGVVLMVGHLLQYHAAFRRLVEIAESGAIGEIKHITSERASFGKIRSEEDVVWSFAPHDLSMILSLAKSEVASVDVKAFNYFKSNVIDIACIFIGFENGINAEVRCSWVHPFKKQCLTVMGSKGALVFEDSSSHSKLRHYNHIVDQSDDRVSAVKGEIVPVEYADGEPLYRECNAFIDACNGARNLTDANEGLKVLKVLKRISPRNTF